MKKMVIALLCLMLSGCGGLTLAPDQTTKVVKKNYEKETQIEVLRYENGVSKRYMEVDDEDWIIFVRQPGLYKEFTIKYFVDEQTYKKAVVGQPFKPVISVIDPTELKEIKEKE